MDTRSGGSVLEPQTRLTEGGTEDLAGVSVLRFRADGLVVEERDFWNQG